MSLQPMFNDILNVSKKASSVPDAKTSSKLSETALRLATAYQIMKECELHEKFHTEPVGGFSLPGETPLKGNN